MSRTVISRADLRYLALEGLVVLFGVLIALVVDGWREEAGRRDAADAAVQRIVEEARLNLQEMEDLQETVSLRLERLQALEEDAPAGVPLADMNARFGGYRTPDLREAAWNRLSGSDLSDLVDESLLEDAFTLYEWARQFDGVTEQIYRLIYSETFYLPDRQTIAIRISERIMEQQLALAADLIPRYRQFLQAAPESAGRESPPR
jgi:hypothetical protein